MKDIGTSNKESFGTTIMDIVRTKNINSIEAINFFCEQHNVNMDDVLPLLDCGMKEQIRVDAIRGRYVRGFKLSELNI